MMNNTTADTGILFNDIKSSILGNLNFSIDNIKVESLENQSTEDWNFPVCVYVFLPSGEYAYALCDMGGNFDYDTQIDFLVEQIMITIKQ